MQEANPELNRRDLGPEAGQDFYQEAQGNPVEVKREWPTAAEREAAADRAKKIIGETKKPQIPEETETGLSAAEAEKLKRDPTAWINEAIGNKNLDGYEATKALEEAMGKDPEA